MKSLVAVAVFNAQSGRRWAWRASEASHHPATTFLDRPPVRAWTRMESILRARLLGAWSLPFREVRRLLDEIAECDAERRAATRREKRRAARA